MDGFIAKKQKRKQENVQFTTRHIKRVAQGSNFVFEGSNRTILDLRGLFTDF